MTPRAFDAAGVEIDEATLLSERQALEVSERRESAWSQLLHDMPDAPTAADRLALAKALVTGLSKQAEADEVLALAEMAEKRIKTFDTPWGQITARETAAVPPTEAVEFDSKAFRRWVIANHPEETVKVQVVRPEFETSARVHLAVSGDDVVDTRDGTVVDYATVKRTEGKPAAPYTGVTRPSTAKSKAANKAATDLVARAFASAPELEGSVDA